MVFKPSTDMKQSILMKKNKAIEKEQDVVSKPPSDASYTTTVFLSDEKNEKVTIGPNFFALSNTNPKEKIAKKIYEKSFIDNIHTSDYSQLPSPYRRQQED